MQIRWLIAGFVLAMFLGMGTASHNGADWNLTDVEVAPGTTGNQSEVTVLVSLEDGDGDPIGPETYDQGISMAYSYDRYAEFQYDFTFINESENRWMTQVPVIEQDSTIDIYAWYDGEHDTFPTGSGEGPHVSASFDPTGNDTAELTHEKPDDRHWYWAVENRTETLTIDVYNQTGYATDGATVNWTLYNWAGAEISNGSSSNEGNGIYQTDITFPAPTQGFYYMDIGVWQGGERTGGGSETFRIDEQLELEIDRDAIVLDNRNQCDITSPAESDPVGEPDEVYTTVCEKGARFNITVNELVNDIDGNPGLQWYFLPPIAFEDDVNESDAYEAWGLDQELTAFQHVSDDTWEGGFTIPRYLNTSIGGTEGTIFFFNATADTPQDFHANDAELSRSEMALIYLDTTPFRVNTRTTDFLAPGDILEIREELRLPFSNGPIEQQEVGTVRFTITNDTGSEIFNITLGDETETIPDEHFDIGGTIRYDWGSPADLATGDYTLQTVATDVYGESVTHEHDFEVKKTQAEGTNASNVIIRDISSGISDYTDRLERSFAEPGQYNGNILLRNNVTDSTDTPSVNISVSESLQDTISINNTEKPDRPFTMQAGEADVVAVNYSFDDFGTYTGTINITVEDNEGSYYRELPVDLSIERDCTLRNGTVCVQTDSRFYSFDIVGEESIDIPVESLADEADEFTMDVEGNLTSILSGTTEEIEAYGSEDLNETIALEQADNGYYSGNLTIHQNGSNHVRVPTTLRVNIPEGSIDVTVEDPDFGTVVQGETFTKDVTIENTGDTVLDNMTLTIDAFNASVAVRDENDDLIELDEGDNTTLTISLNTTDADSSEYTTSDPANIDVQEYEGPRGEAILYGSIIEDIGDDINGLNDDLESVNSLLSEESGSLSETDMSDFEGQVTDLEGRIEDANQAWNNGNYEQAQTSYSEIQSSITELEDQIESAASSGGNNGGGDNGGGDDGGGDDNGGGDNGGGDDDGGDSGGGGISPLLIVIPLLLIIIIGVVAYLSIVPEDDDEQSGGGMDYGPPA